MVTGSQQRAATEFLQKEFQVSQRRAARAGFEPFDGAVPDETESIQTLSGTVLAILPDTAGVKVAKGSGKNQQEVVVTFSPPTEFKGRDGSTKVNFRGKPGS